MSRPRSFWNLLNLPCEGMARLASDSLDRDLTRLERVALRSHRSRTARPADAI